MMSYNTGKIEKVTLNDEEVLVLGVEFKKGHPHKVGQVTLTFPLESVSLTRTESGNSQLSLTTMSTQQQKVF